MVGLLPARFRHLLPGGMHRSIRGLAEVLDTLGVFRAPRSGWAVPVGVSPGSDLGGVGLLPLPPVLRASPDRLGAHPPGLGGVGDRNGGKGQARFGTEEPLSLNPGMIVGRAERYPHGFLSGPSRCPCSRCSSRAPLRARPRGTRREQRRIPFHAGRPGRRVAGILVAAATAHRVRPVRSAPRTARSRSELAEK